jgi:hypothetical protein
LVFCAFCNQFPVFINWINNSKFFHNLLFNKHYFSGFDFHDGDQSLDEDEAAKNTYSTVSYLSNIRHSLIVIT